MNSYGARKFIIAAMTIVAVIGLSMDGAMTPEAANVLTVVNVAFHGANAWIKRNNNDNG